MDKATMIDILRSLPMNSWEYANVVDPSVGATQLMLNFPQEIVHRLEHYPAARVDGVLVWFRIEGLHINGSHEAITALMFEVNPEIVVVFQHRLRTLRQNFVEHTANTVAGYDALIATADVVKHVIASALRTTPSSDK